MTLQETAKELNKAFKKEANSTIEDKIEELENTIKALTRKNDKLEEIIIDLANRLNYLESRCN